MLTLLLELRVGASVVNQAVGVVGGSYGRGRCRIVATRVHVFVKRLSGLHALEATGGLWALVRHLTYIYHIAELLAVRVRPSILLYQRRLPIAFDLISALLGRYRLPIVKELLILFHARVLHVDKLILEEQLCSFKHDVALSAHDSSLVRDAVGLCHYDFSLNVLRLRPGLRLVPQEGLALGISTHLP